jgi:DNA-binding transcriptional MerR regulator
MTVFLRTKDLADAVQISVQQVRNYEAKGFIPVAERSASGYRLYTEQHLAALKTTQQLLGGYGLLRTEQIMQAVHQERVADALAMIDERHTELATLRLQLEQTLNALNLLVVQLPSKSGSRPQEELHVGAAARLVGVQVSALRFWEQQGLLHPLREKGSRYRLYNEQQLRRLRIVVLLRQSHYNFDAIRTTLHELESGTPHRAALAIEQRRNELANLSWKCVEGVAAFHLYVKHYAHKFTFLT